MAKQVPKDGDWSRLLGMGENSNGMVAQTPNGTLVNGRGGDGTTEPMLGDTPGWNDDPRPGVSPMPSYDHSSGVMSTEPYDNGATLPRRVKRK